MIFKIALAFAWLTGAQIHAQNSWVVQLFHDKDNSSLEIRDLACPSARVCVGVGILAENNREKLKGTAVVTSDGGTHWSYVDLKEIPYSLFFLNDSMGWMVTTKGIWMTEESGRSWIRLKPLKGIERVWFLDEKHGFAVGELKTIYETKDGGKEWTKRELANALPLEAKDTVYDSVAFSGSLQGVISGSWNPMQRSQQLAWMEDQPARRAKGMMAAVLVETQDGGATWTEQQVKVDGKFTRLRPGPNLTALGLLEYRAGAAAPSEIFALDLKTRTTKAVFLRKDRVARDLAILPNGELVVAAIELLGRSNEVPIPGKLKMMYSASVPTWLDEKSDYRAVATRPILAVADSNNVWVATDTGMILKRTPTPTPTPTP